MVLCPTYHSTRTSCLYNQLKITWIILVVSIFSFHRSIAPLSQIVKEALLLLTPSIMFLFIMLIAEGAEVAIEKICIQCSECLDL